MVNKDMRDVKTLVHMTFNKVESVDIVLEALLKIRTDLALAVQVERTK